MYSLLIDSSNELGTVILYKDGVLVDSKFSSEKGHSNHMVPMIDEITNNNGIKVKDIKEIIVVNGPGSFTGIRIGVTIAKTISYSLNIPIKVISSLTMIAVSSELDNKLASISDPNGYYIGLYNKNNEVINEFKYITKSEFNKIKDDYNNIDNKAIDYQKVYDYCKGIKCVNPHEIKPLYVKKIEVEL